MVHPATAALLRHFRFAHLPPDLAAVSKPFCDLAHAMVLGDNVPEAGTVTIGGPLHPCAELTAGLRKLLEAKDCAVRAAIEGRASSAPPG